MQIDENTYVVNSFPSAVAFAQFVQAMWQEKRWLTFTWRIGEDRSLDQNALFHVWLSIYAGHILKKDRKQVSKAEREGMKRIAKKKFYAQFGYPWMLIKPINPFTLEEGRPQYSSSSDYKTGEMFQMLTWLQMQAANDGCVLESLGEFQKLQRKNAG